MKLSMRPVVWVLGLALGTPLAAHGQTTYAFQNRALPAEQRVDDLLSMLTLDEKLNLLGTSLNVPRLGIHGSAQINSIPGSSGQFEGLHGLAVGGTNGWNRKSPGPGGDDSVIPTTQFPQPVGMGETWDPPLIQKAAAEEAMEARYIFETFGRGGLIVRAPNADLARDPRWGRSEESFGEDPFLVGTMSVAVVKGLQGDNPRSWTTASLVKHFLANSNEDNREGSSSNFDARLLHEYYAAPFRMAFEQGGANAIMTAYNAVNGTPMVASSLLRTMLMDRWHFNGLIDTDRGALTFLVTKHHYAANMTEAATDAIHAGINQFLNPYEQPVRDALAQHRIQLSDIDENVKGVLRVMLRLGFLDAPSGEPHTGMSAAGTPSPWQSEASRALALQVTRESMVLLRNEHHLLPLDAQKVHSIAVVGPSADTVYLDGYSGTPPFAVTPVAGIRSRAGARVKVSYSAGGAQAIAAARAADVAIVVLGNRAMCHKKTDPPPCPAPSEGQEGIDRQNISLAPDQEQLLHDVYAANPRTILVLVASFPYAIDWADAHIPAIVHMANNSEEEGTALAQTLFGDNDPAGRLVTTWPRSLAQIPPMMDYDIRDGRTYMYFHGAPLFPFGYGLSYTSFRYAGLRASSASIAPGSTVQLTAHVKNTGLRAGDEVVQMYVQYPGSAVARPRLQLVGFKRVSVPAGVTETVSLPLDADALRYWDEARKGWVLEPGRVRVLVGGSSAALPLRLMLAVRQGTGSTQADRASAAP